ncbi:response regulator [Chromobacterium sp. IIBBL 290-4]|uniref:response regulator n=1 Tax=Chromobacterium sp. IIBBL 290-4 TaxID=2953890 RepID=UPI0020B683AC|nr:response regulator [Chromobacterium sp. IIBBL 290-4]UTH75831.1 response regulator [Chromobacterium sp. IIBBL 290-4]
MALDANTTALIVDDSQTMAQSLRAILSMAGVTQTETASNAGDAQNRLRGKHFSLVLCDYNLGRGMNGQELLEAMRKSGALPMSTLWVMITGERNYAQVVTAAETIPDDYILKPVTSQQLLDRLLQAGRRKAFLSPAHKLLDKGKVEQAIAALRERAQQTDNRVYRLDALRLCGELLAREGQYEPALQLYQGLLAQEEIPWAKMGVARILAEQGQGERSNALLDEVIAIAPRYTEAYDLLAQNMIDDGSYQEAAAVLEKAVSISPHNFNRLKNYGTALLRSGDAAAAVEPLQKAVDIGRHNSFFGPEVLVDLLQARSESGQTQQLDRLQSEISGQMGNLPGGQLTMAVCRAMASLAQQRPDQAKAQLEQGAEWLRDTETDFASALRFLGAAVRLPAELAGELPQWAGAITLRFADGRHELGSLKEVARQHEACHAAIKTAYDELQRKSQTALGLANQGQLEASAEMLHREASQTLNQRLGMYGCAMLLRIAENRQQAGQDHSEQMQALRQLLQWLPHDNERVRGFVHRRQALLRHHD